MHTILFQNFWSFIPIQIKSSISTFSCNRYIPIFRLLFSVLFSVILNITLHQFLYRHTSQRSCLIYPWKLRENFILLTHSQMISISAKQHQLVVLTTCHLDIDNTLSSCSPASICISIRCSTWPPFGTLLTMSILERTQLTRATSNIHYCGTIFKPYAATHRLHLA